MSGGAGRGSLLAGGTRTRLVQAGPEEASEAVVFIHGNPGSADDWVRFVGAVGGAGRRAVAFDLPDFGETVAPIGFEHSVPGYARFLAAALEELGIERVHLVVHDFGGAIGLQWAVDNLDSLTGVVLIDTGLMPDYEWHMMARAWRTPILGELLQAITTRSGFRMVQNRVEPRGLPRDFVETMFDHYDRRTRRAVLKLYRATPDPGGMGKPWIPSFAALEIPALVIWGEDDAYLPCRYAEQQRDAFPGAEVHVLAASGHWPLADAPETVERLLVEFLGARAETA